MNTPDQAELSVLREDLAYHQTRILLLVDAVTRAAGHGRKLDGLTKLAKLDFLVRYPALAPVILETLRNDDNRLHLTEEDTEMPTSVESPMTRYKYGPWDDRYYPVIGALVGRGLLRYADNRRGHVALVSTTAGRRLVRALSTSDQWHDIRERCEAIAEASAGLTGSALKQLIYQRLDDLMDRPHGEVIQ
jgi:hypothetical protein